MFILGNINICSKYFNIITTMLHVSFPYLTVKVCHARKKKLFIVCHTATVENNKRVKGLFLIKHNVYLLSAAESACQNFHSQIQFLCPFVCLLSETDSHYSPDSPRNCYASKDGLEPLIPLPPLECWDYQHGLLYTVLGSNRRFRAH